DLPYIAPDMNLRAAPVIGTDDRAGQFGWHIGLQVFPWLNTHLLQIGFAQPGFAKDFMGWCF
ncbi:MAG TPA: hypothetical protein VMV33_11745, partial [Rhodocyclaceae bacterium]|nr:hypothetical protein [Rhodocyclaceae bacterium]